MITKRTWTILVFAAMLVLILGLQAFAQVGTYLQNGERYLAEGNWTAAVNEFRFALNQEPQNTQAWYGLGRAYEGQSGAKAWFDSEVERLTGPTEGEPWATNKEASQLLDEAIKAFTNAQSYYPPNTQAIAGLARSLYTAGRRQEAFIALERTISPFQPNADALAHMLYLSMMSSDAQRLTYYISLAKAAPTLASDQYIIHALAAAEYKSGNYQAAEAALTPMMYRYDIGHLPFKAMGDILLALGRPLEAVNFYKYAATINPKSLGSLIMGADIASLTGDPAAAAAGYRSAILLAPKSFWARVGLARSLFEQGDISGAAGILKQLTDEGGGAYPDMAFTYKGVVERAQGQLQQAELSLKSALSLNSSNQVAQQYLGIVQSEMRARGVTSLVYTAPQLAPFDVFVINGGAQKTNNRKVTINVNIPSSYFSFKNEIGDYSGWGFKFGATASLEWLLSDGDGNKTVRIRTRDGLFSIAQEGITREIFLDATPPTIITREAKLAGTNLFVMNVKAEDALSGISYFWLSQDGQEWKPYRWIGGSFPFAFKAAESRVVTVAIVDGVGNQAPFQTNVSQYIPGPVISDVTAQETGTGKVTVRWSTDRLASSYVEYKLGQSSNVVGSETSTRTHSVDVSGLIAGQTYQFKPVSVDSYGVKTEGQAVILTLSQPVKPPTISGLSATGLSANTATVMWNTDVQSYGYVVYSAPGIQLTSQQVGPAFSHQMNLTGLQQLTTYQYQVVAWDAQGRQSYSEVKSFTTLSADRMPPTVSNLRVNGGAQYTNNRTVGLELFATDDSGYVAEMSFRDDASNWSAWAPYGSYSSFVLSDRDGLRTIYARVRDSVGNVSSEMTARITLDRTAPRISWVGAKTGLDNAEITWDTDEDSDSWVFFGTSSASLTFSQGQSDAVRSHRVFLTGLRADTTYFYKVMSRDQSGNSAESAVSSFRTQPAMPADTKAPTGSISINDNSMYTRSRYVYLNLYAQDDRSSQSEIQYRVGEGSTSYNISWGSWQAFAPRPQYMLEYGDGQRNVWVMYRDAAGNLSQIYGASIILDTKAPTISSVNAINVGTTGAVITFRTNEPCYASIEFGTATYSLSMQTGEPEAKSASITTAEPSSVIITPNPPQAKQGYTEFSIGLTGLKPSTTYYFRVVAMDMAGNTSASQIASFRTQDLAPSDVQAPTGSVTINDNTRYTKSRYIYLNLSAQDNVSPTSQIQYRIGEGLSSLSISWGGWNQFSSKVPYTLGIGDGQRNIWVVYKDAAGNMSQAYSASIILDTKAPVVTNLAAVNVTTNSATITWNTNEPAFGSVEFGTSTGSLSSLTGDSTVRSASISEVEPSSIVITPNPTAGRTGSTAFSLNLTNLKADTTYYFRAVAMDLAGNVGASQLASFRTAAIVAPPPVVTPPVVTPPVVTPPVVTPPVSPPVVTPPVVTPPVVTPPVTPAPGASVNLAGKSQGAKAEANGWTGANSASLAIDENASTMWMSENVADESTPQVLKVIFGKTVSFNSVVVKFGAIGAAKTMKVMALINNKWVEVYDYKSNRPAGSAGAADIETVTMNFSRVQATQLQLFIYSPAVENQKTRIYEVEVYNK